MHQLEVLPHSDHTIFVKFVVGFALAEEEFDVRDIRAALWKLEGWWEGRGGRVDTCISWLFVDEVGRGLRLELAVVS